VGSTLALAHPHYYNRLVQLASTIFGTISGCLKFPSSRCLSLCHLISLAISLKKKKTIVATSILLGNIVRPYENFYYMYLWHSPILTYYRLGIFLYQHVPSEKAHKNSCMCLFSHNLNARLTSIILLHKRILVMSPHLGEPSLSSQSPYQTSCYSYCKVSLYEIDS
jgi:hypothetical protein